jgi:hypothetical protein
VPIIIARGVGGARISAMVFMVVNRCVEVEAGGVVDAIVSC